MHGVSFVVMVVWSYIVPSVGFTDFYGFGGRCLFRCVHTLELPDIVDELQVVNVTLVTPSCIGLNIAAAVPVVLIWKCHIIGPVWGPVGSASCNVFVPTGYEHQFGVYFKSTIPLFLEIPAVEVSINTRIESFEHAEVTSECFRFVEGTEMPSAGKIGILGNTYYGLFKAAVRKWGVAVLRIDFHPSPLIVSFGAVNIIGLSGAESEKFSNFLILF